MIKHKCNTLLMWIISCFILTSCAAISTSITHKDLDIQTKMSNSIFLDPVESNKKIIYVDIRNTSDKTNFDIAPVVQSALQAKGYTLTNDPKTAHYWLRANILSVDKATQSAAQSALNNGFGGAIAGAALGGTIGAANDGYAGYGIMAGGLAGMAIESIANSAVKEITYIVVTDVEIAEQVDDGIIVRQDNQQSTTQGVDGTQYQNSSEISDKRRFRTRIVSTANKVNLEYEEAAPSLTDGLVRSISGLF